MHFMSAANSNLEDQQAQCGLFGECETPKSAAGGVEMTFSGGEARVLYADRHQVELRSFDLEASLPPDHPARTVWAFVQSMDLSPLYAAIKSRQGGRGAPAIDPAILTSLWLWATIDGIGSGPPDERAVRRR